MTLMKGRNINSNDSATMSGAITVSVTTSTVIAVANVDRIFFCVNNNDAVRGMWLKLQAASVDNDAKGIWLPPGGAWMMPSDNIYTGEVCGLADVVAIDAYYTEY